MRFPFKKVACAGAMALALLLSGLPPGIAAERAPIEVAKLYIQVVVNHDPAAAEQLNAYLRPVRQRLGQPGDHVVYDDLKRADANDGAEVADVILEVVPAGLQDRLKPAIVELMNAEYEAELKTDGRSLEATSVKDEEGMQTTAVRFECRAVKVPETWAEVFQRLAEKPHGEADYLREIRRLKVAYDAPPRGAVKREFPLARETQDGIWRNDLAREAFLDIL